MTVQRLPTLPAGATMKQTLPYTRRGVPAEVSLLQSHLAILPVIAMAEGERWVRGDCRYEFPPFS